MRATGKIGRKPNTLIFFTKKAKPRENQSLGASVNLLARFFVAPNFGSRGRTARRKEDSQMVLSGFANALITESNLIFSKSSRPYRFRAGGTVGLFFFVGERKTLKERLTYPIQLSKKKADSACFET